jgi:hypothetical protein
MPTTVPDVTDGDLLSETWGDAVRLAVTELQTAPPAHGSTHQPGGTDALPTATAGASAVGDTAAAGSSTSLARADHRHSREAFGAAAAASAGDASANGTATTVSHSDHKHGLPVAAPGSSAVGDSVGAGSSSSVARADHQHGREAFAAPVAVGSGNAAGAASTVARSNHVHAAQGPGIQAVRQATGSLTTGATTDVTVTWGTAFADANYSVTANFEQNLAFAGAVTCMVKTRSAASCVISVRNQHGSSVNGSIDAIAVHD